VSPGLDSAHFLSLAQSHMGAKLLTPMDPAAAGSALVGRELTAPSLTGYANRNLEKCLIQAVLSN
jgi:hypothetical protein